MPKKKTVLTKVLLLTSLLCTVFMEINALDLTRQDFRYLYDPYSPVAIKHKMSCTNGVYSLYFMLNLKNPLRKEHYFEISLMAQNGYKDKNEMQLDATLAKEDSSRRLILLKYQFKVKGDYDLMYADFLINGVNYYYDIPINSGLQFPCSEVVPLKENGWPYFDNFIVEGANVTFESDIYTFQYNDQFSTAQPPIVSGIEPKSGTIKIDTSFQSSSFIADRERVLSFVQTDSSSSSGCSFLTVSPYYPKLRRVDDLTGPIFYLFTKKSEFEEVKVSKDKKKAFDRFWVTIIPSHDRARSVVKRYFNNVTLANKLFTDYKEGWRTDRGMIFSVYGYPKEVQRTAEKETWTYTINGKKLNFNFAKVPNLFVQHHYELMRDKDLSKVWLNEVGKWRKGNM